MKLEILILGLLLENNLYGYEIKKKLTERLGEYEDINFGSIYYTIKKVLDSGWIKRIATERHSLSPECYIYQITPNGRKYYKKLLKKYFEDAKIHFEIDIVLMFLNSLDPASRKTFIAERKELLKEKLVQIKDTIDAQKKKSNSIHVFTYLENHIKAELNWIRSLDKKNCSAGLSADCSAKL